MSNDKKPKTETYVLKPGQEHNGFSGEGENRVRHLYRGDESDNNKVELTEAQFQQFKDKFITEASAKELRAKQDELNTLRKREKEIADALADKGVTIEELLAAHTAKKPDTNVATENEPTQANNTPAATGSTSDPINAPATPATGSAEAPKPAGKK